jgi:molecular chaperone HscB
MMNYFEIFDLEINTKIDLEKLEEQYFDFQQKFHPDKATTQDIEKSILVNQAFEVLKKPFSRLSYILKLNNIDILDDTKAPKVDAKTLEEIWELQEELMNSSKEEKQNLQSNLKIKINNLLAESAKEISQKNFEQAAQILIQTKYFDKILKDLKSKQ